jgi:hypothetical protein
MLKAINVKWVLIIAATIGVFVWVSVRPYIDRKQCSEESITKVKSLGGMQGDKQLQLYGERYLLCVNSKGLGD